MCVIFDHSLDTFNEMVMLGFSFDCSSFLTTAAAALAVVGCEIRAAIIVHNHHHPHSKP